MGLLERVQQDGVTPEVTRPAPGKVLAGDPVHTTWPVDESEGLYCGIWQSTPGKWRVAYDEWENMHLREGISIVTDAAGHAVTLRAGDSYVIRPGFTGTWEVVETTVKDYVIRL